MYLISIYIIGLSCFFESGSREAEVLKEKLAFKEEDTWTLEWNLVYPQPAGTNEAGHSLMVIGSGIGFVFPSHGL